MNGNSNQNINGIMVLRCRIGTKAAHKLLENFGEAYKKLVIMFKSEKDFAEAEEKYGPTYADGIPPYHMLADFEILLDPPKLQWWIHNVGPPEIISYRWFFPDAMQIRLANLNEVEVKDGEVVFKRQDPFAELKFAAEGMKGEEENFQ